MNAYVEEEENPLDLLEVDLAVETEQLASLKKVKQNRNNAEVERTLSELKRVAEAAGNVFPSLVDAAHARVTVGETMETLADVFGRYHPGSTW